MNRDIQKLLLINEYILKIEKYTLWISFNDFITDEQKFDAVCMVLLQIWEMWLKLEEWISLKNINIDEMRWFRNRITHDYMWLNDEVIWDTIKISLPRLKSTIDNILKSLS